MFNFTVCTYDGKKCLMMLKKNDMDVCALIDQDGNDNCNTIAIIIIVMGGMMILFI